MFQEIPLRLMEALGVGHLGALGAQVVEVGENVEVVPWHGQSDTFTSGRESFQHGQCCSFKMRHQRPGGLGSENSQFPARHWTCK